MVSSAVAALSAALSLARAPVQCGQNEPDMRLEDDPGETLWTLAARFEREGRHDAAVETWSMIAERYPANRHADEARRLSRGARDGG